MEALDHVLDLVSITHFHQGSGRHPVPRRMPADRELIELVTGGRGSIETETGWREVSAGDLIWQCPGDLTIARSDFTDPYRCLAVQVAIIPGSPRPAPRVTRWEEKDEVRAFTHQAVRWSVDERFDRHALLAWVYSSLLYRARLSEHRERQDDLPSALRRVLDILDARYAEDLSLDDCAAVANWSVAHLHAEFRRHLDTTPHRYLVDCRLRAARHLLTTTDQTLNDIAGSCGFSSSVVLCRVFKKETGVSPGAYRRKNLVA
jgi:AraC-like DNA-binding protein